MHNIDKHTIKAIITEEINLLMEDRATDNRSKARKYARSKGVSDEEAKELDQKLMHDLPNLRLSEFKYMLGVTRMFLNNELTNGNDITKLNTYLKLLSVEPHLSEYDRDINGLTFNQLDEKFKTIQQDVTNKEREESLNTQFEENKDYDIVRIPDYETASKYGEYTDWCVTHTEAAYENYTGGGTGLFYFCLKKGFENVPEEEGPNSPLDDYGLSMIAVSVNMDGSPNTITSRWNHACGGSDSVMDYKELEKIIGRSFYATFKPYSREELHAKGVILFDEVQGLLDSGKKPEEVFGMNLYEKIGGFRVVGLNNRWNYIDKNNKLLSKQWFNYCGNFWEGFGVVELNGKQNYIKPDGTLLSSEWFDECNDFNEGFGAVKLKNKWNYIKPDGTLLSSEWFDKCNGFYGGFGGVVIKGKCNYIKPDGTLLSEQWFDNCYVFDMGFGVVKLNGKYNYIKPDGKLLSDTWFDKCNGFYGGFGGVVIKGKCNYIKPDGQLLSPNQWFDDCFPFQEGFGRVEINGKENYIKPDGEFLSEQWFDSATDFRNGVARVALYPKKYMIDKNGKITPYTKENIEKRKISKRGINENKNRCSRRIKITLEQLNHLIRENFISNSSDTDRHNVSVDGKILDNIPMDNTNIEPLPITGDKRATSLTRNAWWTSIFGGYVAEDTDRAMTQHIPWRLPNNVKNYLYSVREKYKDGSLSNNAATKEAWDHLNDILKMDETNGIRVEEMKRIKHWFDYHNNANNSIPYELYGGNIMKMWVNSQLMNARQEIKKHKELKRMAGINNAYKKPHSKINQTIPNKID